MASLRRQPGSEPRIFGCVVSVDVPPNGPNADGVKLIALPSAVAGPSLLCQERVAQRAGLRPPDAAGAPDAAALGVR
jgi:hypothetical protein